MSEISADNAGKISGSMTLAGQYSTECMFIFRFGRQKPMSFYAVAGGISCILAGVLSKDTGNPTDHAYFEDRF
jgi:hypothetical protein